MTNQQSTTTAASSGGISTAGLLGIAFVVLKLTGVINWSWWWVLLPFWGGAALFLVGAVLFGLVMLGLYLLDHKSSKKK